MNRGRGRGRGRNTYYSPRGWSSPGENYGSSDVPTERTDASSQYCKLSSWPRVYSKQLDHTLSYNHQYQTKRSFPSDIRNSRLTPNSSQGNYPSFVKDQSWRREEMTREINYMSLVNSEFTLGKSAMPTQYGFEKAGYNSSGRPENFECKNLLSRSALFDPGNKHPIAANRQGGKSEISRVSILKTVLTPGKSSAVRAKREPFEEEKIFGQTSDIKAGSVGKSEHSDSYLEKSFDIFPEKPGNLVRLHVPLLLRNSEKRNEMKHSMEGRSVHILRLGMILLKNYISSLDQINIIKVCRKLGLGSGGFYQPRYCNGNEMHLKMMCLGLHWDPDTRFYRNLRPTDGAKPPVIPNEFHQLVKSAIEESHFHLQKQKSTSKNVEATLPSMLPDICIVNFFSKSGRLGLHQDIDESAESLERGLPVVSLSVGDSAEFLFGDDRDPEYAEKVVLASGDVLIFGGKSRFVFHGVTNILADTAPKTLLEATNFRSPGRLNLTFRQF